MHNEEQATISDPVNVCKKYGNILGQSQKKTTEEQKSNHHKVKENNVMILHQNRFSKNLERLGHFFTSVNPDILVLTEYGFINHTIK